MPLVRKGSDSLDRELDGVWVDYDEGQLLIARMGNPRNRAVYNRLMKPHARKAAQKTLSPAVQEKVVSQCYAETLLLDWKGMVDEYGNELEYSQALAEEILLADMDLRQFVEEQANNAALFRSEFVEETVGKSATSYDGESGGDAVLKPSPEHGSGQDSTQPASQEPSPVVQS